jgi:hypothetical protein
MGIVDEANRHHTVTINDEKYTLKKLTLNDFSLIRAEIADRKRIKRRTIQDEVPDGHEKSWMLMSLIEEPSEEDVNKFLQTNDGILYALYLMMGEKGAEDFDGYDCIGKYIDTDNMNEIFGSVIDIVFAKDDSAKKSGGGKRGRPSKRKK